MSMHIDTTTGDTIQCCPRCHAETRYQPWEVAGAYLFELALAPCGPCAAKAPPPLRPVARR